MHKNVQTILEKFQKFNTTLLLFYVDARKKFESNKKQWISFRPERWDISYRNPSCLFWEAPVCEKHIPKPAPNGTKNFYHGMLVPLHDSMPSFMNFRWVLDLLEFKNQASQCFAANQRCPSVWNSLPFLAWDLSIQPRTHIWFFNRFICTRACACNSNLINELKTQLMHKNVQTNPE